MSINSDKLGLIIPDRGEFPGEWDLPLNDNLEKIDLILWKAYTHNPSDTQPGTTESIGSPWYKTAQKLLMLKGADGVYHAAARHIHDGTIPDIPKVLLTDGREVQGVLPGFMVDAIGLDAEKLGGRFANQYVTIGGTGIEVYTDTATGLGAARIQSVAGFLPSQEFTKVTVDIAGRVIAGDKPNTLSGLGITDGVTKAYADSTYATIATLTSGSSTLFGSMQTWAGLNYAPKVGDSGQTFLVKTDAVAPVPSQAVSVQWAQNNLALLNGSSINIFRCANAVGANDALPLGQASLLYEPKGTTHDLLYARLNAANTFTSNQVFQGNVQVDQTLTVAGNINLNGGGSIPANKWIVAASAPTIDQHLANKKYIDDKFTASTLSPSAIASAYAAKNGNIVEIFNAADATDPMHVINQRAGDARYATSSNLSSLRSSIEGTLSGLDSIYIRASGSPKVSSGRMGIMRSRLTSGVPDILTINGDKSIDLFASSTEPCVVAVPGGVTQNGSATFVVFAKDIISDIFESNTIKADYVFATYTELNAELIKLADPNPLISATSRIVSEGVYRVTADENHAGATYIYIRNRLNTAWQSQTSGNTIPGIPLPNSATLYAMLRVRPGDYAQGVEFTNIAPIYSYDTPIAPADRQFWFNLNEECFYRYHAAITTWEKYPAAMMATIITDGTGTPITIAMYDSKLTYDFKVPAPTMNMQVPNKKYVDDAVASVTNMGPKFKITPEGGYAIKLINKTGAPSIKGTLVKAGAVVDESFETMFGAVQLDTIGIVYDNAVVDGQECYVVVSGIAQVLLKNTTASTRGNWVIASDVNGRADATQPTPTPNNTLGEHTQHFKEIGHCLESKVAGTNVLAKCVIHFN